MLVVGKCVTNDLYRLREAVGEGNGFEYWRKLFIENKGGGETIRFAQRKRFDDFPRCRGISDLEKHLEEWIILKSKVNPEMSEEWLLIAFGKIIPTELEKELNDRQYLHQDMGTLENAFATSDTKSHA